MSMRMRAWGQRGVGSKAVERDSRAPERVHDIERLYRLAARVLRKDDRVVQHALKKREHVLARHVVNTGRESLHASATRQALD